MSTFLLISITERTKFKKETAAHQLKTLSQQKFKISCIKLNIDQVMNS